MPYYSAYQTFPMDNNESLIMPFEASEPWLAPLAGFSDLPFRLLCRENGAAAAVTEMISAKGLVYGSRGTGPLLETCPEDLPLAVQLFGSETPFLDKAAAMLIERGFSNLDLNAGCSVRKVVKTGAGAALLAEPQKLAELARSLVRRAGAGRVGVKLRLGIRPGEETYMECARRLQDEGVGWLALHPRYAAQGFAGDANHRATAEIAKSMRIPVIASGDLMTAEDAVSCIRETGAAGVMFARGALKDPLVFDRYRHLSAGRKPADKTAREIIDVVSRHAQLAREHARDQAAELKKMRTVVPRYIKGIPGAGKLRNSLVKVSSWRELEELMQELEHAN